jgi:histidine triad (HIT) family protein
MDVCVFCRMVAGEISVAKVYENDAVLAFLDIAPVSDGHTLVISKQHCTRVHECAPEVLADLAMCLGKIAKAVITTVGSDGYNVLINNGSAAGQVVDHLHVHVIPRKAGDGVLAGWPSHPYEGQVEKLAAKIRANLE